MEEKKPENKKIWIAIILISVIIIGICLSILIIRWFSDSSFDHAVEQVTEAIKGSYAGQNSIEVSGHTVNIRIWSDGVMNIAKAAYDGDRTQLQNWNALKDKVYLLAGQIYDKFLFVDDAVVFLRYVNDQNPDRDLLVFKNKQMVYDVVQGGD